MKKKTIYGIAVVVLCLGFVAIVYSYRAKQKKEEQSIYTLLPRKGASARSEEWKDVQSKAKEYLDILSLNPDDTKAALRLSALYIQEARETGNYMYYDKAAMKYINRVLAANPSDFNALVFKSLIFMSQHHFADGLAVAQQARTVNPDNGYVYGLLVDGNVELGNYDSAVYYGDKMVAIRPDLTSYSRISYLREIFGNYKGAIEAMKMAVDAGGRGDEHTEWTRAQLGQLYEKTGDYASAQQQYEMSLSMRPDYPYAIAGMARIAAANKDYSKAISLYEKADSLIADNGFKEELSDLYRATGQTARADKMINELITELNKNTQKETDDPTLGHYSDKELAYAYLKINKPDAALKHATLEYNRRPFNIDVNETVAWVYYNKGEYDKARAYIHAALKTNSKNPVLLSRAGLIYYKAGEKEIAKTLLTQASSSKAFVGDALEAQTSAAMQSM